MKLKFLLFICLVFLCLSSAKAIESEYTMHMDTLPYYEIPDAPEMYNAATVAARMVDGLGFRYYWATEGLRAEDLAHEPGNDGQSCSSVIEHVLGLSRFVLRTVKGEVHDNTREYPELNFEGQRTETLKNLKDPRKIKAVQDWPTPSGPRDVRGFLGLAGYYRKFIHRFAARAAPLFDLTKHDIDFKWTQGHQAAFDDIKAAMAEEPVLISFSIILVLWSSRINFCSWSKNINVIFSII